MQVLLGCGSNHAKKLSLPGKEGWEGLVTVDFDASHNPNVIYDLSDGCLPFEASTCDEIHAYDVMEHFGQQGDFRFFFRQWSNIWKALKPGGHFFGISPHWLSPWAWMDPGHCRVFGPEILTFLSQPNYDAQVGITPMTDYRFCYRADFDLIRSETTQDLQFIYVLRAVKPSRFDNGA